MSAHHKLSLRAAMLININIMLGSGLFLNTLPLSTIVGGYSPLVYMIVGVLMLPLIIAVARLLAIYPGGSLYTFGNHLGPLWGFIAAWSYFTGKLGSCAIMIHFFATNIQQAFPWLQCTPTMLLDCCVIAIFTLLNLLNMQTGSIIQTLFITLKGIPILAIILLGMWYGDLSQLAHVPASISSIPIVIPLIIYAFSGFEATCSLSAHIENPQRNGPRAVLYAFGIVVTIATLFQLVYFASIDLTALATTPAMHGMTLFVRSLFTAARMQQAIIPALSAAVAISALGGAYGIMFSNNWNLYTLAQHGHTYGARYLLQKNKYHIAHWCILIQSSIITGYLLLTNAHQLALQQVSAFGGTIATTLAVISLLVWLQTNRNKWLTVIAWAALGSCLLLLGCCLCGFIAKGIIGLVIFSILAGIGLIMYSSTTKGRQSL
ncbi:APC family permease [Candidatus Dependentiae bacterium]|nr:APC family permease [Candidatus Dependentiae bacterium]